MPPTTSTTTETHAQALPAQRTTPRPEWSDPDDGLTDDEIADRDAALYGNELRGLRAGVYLC